MTIRIFLADDHAILREGLKALLEAQNDFTVLGNASNGRDAVRQARRQCPDVILMDIAMPEMNGVEAASQIREHCPETAIIILSIHATREHVQRALRAGARGYLLKESAGAEVIAAVRAVHEGRRYLSEKIAGMVIDEFTAQTRAGDPLAGLSPREREILQLVAEGKSSAEVAQLLSLSPKTVETYRSRLMQKLGLPDLPALVKFAIQHGLISLE